MARPRTVTVAVILFGISLAIRIYGELSFAYFFASESGNYAFQLGRLALPMAFYTLQAWIIWNVAKGRNWSRIALIAIVILNTGITSLVLGNPLGQLLTSPTIVLAQIVGEVMAVVLLLLAADFYSTPHGAT